MKKATTAEKIQDLQNQLGAANYERNCQLKYNGHVGVRIDRKIRKLETEIANLKNQ